MYTSKQQVETYIKRSLTESEDAFLSIINPAIKAWIDAYTNSNFSKVNPSTRYYDNEDWCEGSIDLDPCTDITQVSAVNEQTNEDYYVYFPYQYIAEPRNETVKRELVRKDAMWPEGWGNIAVTARYSEWVNGVPEDVTAAATIMAAGIINSGLNHTDNLKSETIEGYKYDLSDIKGENVGVNDPLAKSLLEHRRQLLVG